MNKKLLLKVKERILNEKIPVVMHTWFSVRKTDAKKNWKEVCPIGGVDNWAMIDGYLGMTKIPSKDGIAEHGCKTAGCVAGHAIMEKWGGKPLKSLSKKYPDLIYLESKEEGYSIDFSELGAEALELDSYQAGTLFVAHNWPEQFSTPYFQYMGERKYKKANQVVADRIDYFIETGE